jgi:hypothetical protein
MTPEITGQFRDFLSSNQRSTSGHVSEKNLTIAAIAIPRRTVHIIQVSDCELDWVRIIFVQ